MNMPENTSPSSVPRARRRPLLRKVAGLFMAQEGPPDLEEMWRDFKRKLSSFFGMNRRSGGGSGGSDPGNGFQPDARSAGVGVVAIALIVALVWLFSGSFIVQE